MKQIVRTRRVNFSGRPSKSDSFKVNAKNVPFDSELLVKIASKDASGVYYFKGKDVQGLDSIHFYLEEHENLSQIRWSGAQPYKNEIQQQRQPIIFLRTAWMKNYRGVNDEDIPSGAGSFVTENLDGGEVYNFLPINGEYHGYAHMQSGRNLNIERLGVTVQDNAVKNVTVIFFSKKPDTGGEFIVGFYKKAILHRNVVDLPKHKRGGHSFYLTKAKISDSSLIEESKRSFQVPNDGPGQSNVWYAEEYHDKNFLKTVMDYIDNPNLYTEKRKGRKINHKAWQPDAEKRKAVELAAMEMTAEYFTNTGWDIKDVHKDNVGWDMEAVKHNEHLLLEIKGLSGTEMQIELSVNEYANSKKNTSKYRVCIVTNALDKQKKNLNVFYHKKGAWLTNSGIELSVQERTSAILKLK